MDLQSVTIPIGPGGRKLIFTEEVYAQIPIWVNNSETPEFIAHRLKCKVTTLKVMCSRRRISLMKKKEVPLERRRLPRTEVSDVAYDAFFAKATSLRLRPRSLLRLLLEKIAEDDIWDAVLDFDKEELMS